MGNPIDNLLAMTGVEVISGKFFHCDKNWRQEQRVLPDSMWYWLKRGACICELEGNVHRFNPGELFMIPAGCSHVVYPTRPHVVETITVHFHARCYAARDVAGLLSLGGVYADVDYTYRKASESIAAEFDRQSPGYLWNVESCVKQVLTEIIRRKSDVMTWGDSFMRLQRLGEVLPYIEKNLALPLRIDQLADIAGVSEVYLRKLFRMCGLASPANFIIQRRIFHACELLKSTTGPIKSIATACGFADLPFFYKTFRKITGHTPADFRRHPEI